MDQIWDWLGWLLAGLATFVAFRTTVRFDVNEWLRDRRKQKEDNLRLLCPHARPVIENGTHAISSTYISPVGTTAWQCQMCGDVTHDRDEINDAASYWARHPDQFIRRTKDIARLAKKLGRG